jgi:hypothetical protein
MVRLIDYKDLAECGECNEEFELARMRDGFCLFCVAGRCEDCKGPCAESVGLCKACKASVVATCPKCGIYWMDLAQCIEETIANGDPAKRRCGEGDESCAGVIAWRLGKE